jgi:hypothetical protein
MLGELLRTCPNTFS